MATGKENIALMPVIFPPDSPKGSIMTKEQFEREQKYQVALSLAQDMLRQNVINELDFLRIESKLTEKFKPTFGGFLC